MRPNHFVFHCACCEVKPCSLYQLTTKNPEQNSEALCKKKHNFRHWIICSGAKNKSTIEQQNRANNYSTIVKYSNYRVKIDNKAHLLQSVLLQSSRQAWLLQILFLFMKLLIKSKSIIIISTTFSSWLLMSNFYAPGKIV